MATGRCLCEAVEFEVLGDPSVLCLCHCSLCRRSVGATPVAWATYVLADFRLLRGEPIWFQASVTAQRGFCGRCGCSLFFKSTRFPEEVDVTIVAMDNASTLVPDRHIWVPSKLPWVNTDDGLPCHAEGSASGLVSGSA
jgi:hypothetical protein